VIVHADVESRSARFAALAAAASLMITCSGAEGARRRSSPVPAVQEGKASYYGKGFAGRKTASGERFDPNLMTAAHNRLPLGTKVRVTRKDNGVSVTVRVNDRCGCTHGRIIDVSEGAARKLGMIREGVVKVRLEVIGK
jgi:rare lipoprotein A